MCISFESFFVHTFFSALLFRCIGLLGASHSVVVKVVQASPLLGRFYLALDFDIQLRGGNIFYYFRLYLFYIIIFVSCIYCKRPGITKNSKKPIAKIVYDAPLTHSFSAVEGLC